MLLHFPTAEEVDSFLETQMLSYSSSHSENIPSKTLVEPGRIPIDATQCAPNVELSKTNNGTLSSLPLKYNALSHSNDENSDKQHNNCDDNVKTSILCTESVDTITTHSSSTVNDECSQSLDHAVDQFSRFQIKMFPLANEEKNETDGMLLVDYSQIASNDCVRITRSQSFLSFFQDNSQQESSTAPANAITLPDANVIVGNISEQESKQAYTSKSHPSARMRSVSERGNHWTSPRNTIADTSMGSSSFSSDSSSDTSDDGGDDSFQSRCSNDFVCENVTTISDKIKNRIDHTSAENGDNDGYIPTRQSHVSFANDVCIPDRNVDDTNYCVNDIAMANVILKSQQPDSSEHSMVDDNKFTDNCITCSATTDGNCMKKTSQICDNRSVCKAIASPQLLGQIKDTLSSVTPNKMIDTAHRNQNQPNNQPGERDVLVTPSTVVDLEVKRMQSMSLFRQVCSYFGANERHEVIDSVVDEKANQITKKHTLDCEAFDDTTVADYRDLDAERDKESTHKSEPFVSSTDTSHVSNNQFYITDYIGVGPNLDVNPPVSGLIPDSLSLTDLIQYRAMLYPTICHIHSNVPTTEELMGLFRPHERKV